MKPTLDYLATRARLVAYLRTLSNEGVSLLHDVVEQYPQELLRDALRVAEIERKEVNPCPKT